MKMNRLFLFVAAMGISMAAWADNSSRQWVGTWAAAAEFTGEGDMPSVTLADHSLRQIVHVSIGGSTLRLQLSNEFSEQPVEIRSVYIADAMDGWQIDVKTARYLSFNGRRDVILEPGTALFSDAVAYPLRPLQRLSVTINYGRQVPEHATSHRGSRTTSYIISGVSKPKSCFEEGERVDHWYNIAAIDVLSDASTPCAAILGNSITDGRGSTTNAQDRWPDRMAEALYGEVAVLNLGIGGNCVLEGGLSEPAMKRFDRDILGQRGVTTLVIFQGVNDIGGSNGNSEQVAARLIEAYKTLVAKARAKGMNVYLATITPFKGNSYYTFFHEAARQTVNEWIRKSGIADGIMDFDELVRNPADPAQLKEEYSDDWLHLNATGYAAMGRYAAEILKNNKR